MAESLLNEKVRDFLYEKAKVTYVSEDEYYAAEDADAADQDDSTVSDTEAFSEDIVDEMTDEQE